MDQLSLCAKTRLPSINRPTFRPIGLLRGGYSLFEFKTYWFCFQFLFADYLLENVFGESEPYESRLPTGLQ